MYRILIFPVAIFILVSSAASTTVAQPLVVPQPKSMQILGEPFELEPNKVAIVVGAKATEPEQYAADRLRVFVNKRFARQWPTVRENSDLKPFSTLIVIGQETTNKLVQSVCRDLKINAAEMFPIPDGYALSVGRVSGKTVAVVAGSNPRSVIFGQNTLFQLIYKDGGKLKLWPAQIRDWPSLPHRGRVCTSVDQFYSAEVLDAAALGRLNFIDLRYGTYGTPPDHPLDHERIKWVINEAHRRGLLVYGTVSLVAQPSDYDKVIAKFQEFIDLGVDGIWPYLGDPGGYGRSGTPLELIERVLELGKKHGMTGDLVHYTPGKRGYVDISNVDNFSAAKVPGMDDALWFFAVKPTAQACADAAKLGLKKKYVWWNHWPHPRGGFTSCGNPSMRADGKSNIYADLTPFHDAYQSPTQEELANVPQYASGAIPWGGSIWHQVTILGPFGWWAWSPETHDWQQTRRRVYDYLYGPDLVDTAFELNNLLAELKSKVVLCGDEHEGKDYVWPPILRDTASRPHCRELIEKMYAPLTKLEQGASAKSLIGDDDLHKYFFEPMRAELAAAKVIIELPRTEYWWEANLRRILTALREGNCEQAIRWQAEARERAKADWETIHKSLAGVVNPGWSGLEWVGKLDALHGDAKYVSDPITLDGELNEPAWSTTPKLGSFRIYNDKETYETPSTAQVLYSEDALYIGLNFAEPNMDMLVANNTEHDSAVWEDDSFDILINTDGFGVPYYHFAANTLGTKREELRPEDAELDPNWNGQWDVKIAKHSDGWTAEVRIPYSTLGASKPKKGTLWLCNFGRTDRASAKRIEQGENWREQSAWGYRPRGHIDDSGKFRPLWFK